MQGGAPRPRVKEAAALGTTSPGACGDTRRGLLERRHRRGAVAATLEQIPAGGRERANAALEGAAAAG